MIISMKKDTPEVEIRKLIERIEAQGLSVTLIRGANYNVFGVVGDTTILDEKVIAANPHVDTVTRIAAPYKKANRLFHPEDTIVDVSGVRVGAGQKVVVIGGPCAVEGEEQIRSIARSVREAGGAMLRGGAYKPRTSPYTFQGMMTEGISLLRRAGDENGLPIVSELMGWDRLDEFNEHVDLIQVGARNMQNFELLKALGRATRPVLLKRGLSNTIEEWLMAAEYIMASGNEQVILCERGIRTFERLTRNTLDLSVVPIIKARSHLPIIIDPSHATGDWRLVESMALASIAAGADGLIIEVHNDPERAWSDGAQSLKPDRFAALIEKGRLVARAVGRNL